MNCGLSRPLLSARNNLILYIIMNRKVLLLIITVAVFFLLLGVLIFFPWINHTAVNPAVTPIISKQPGATPTPLPAVFTGEKPAILPSQTVKEINSAFELRKKLPIKESAFSLTYDYEKALFVVVLTRPYAENKNIFNQWLIDNGYSAIPKDQFSYKEL